MHACICTHTYVGIKAQNAVACALPILPFVRQGGTCGQSKGPDGLLGVLPRSKWLPNGPEIEPLNLGARGCE